jgi:RNA polymerase sigma-70 factor (ECF subfamily)
MQASYESMPAEALVLQAQCGDEPALEQLLASWYPKLLRQASRRLRNEDAAKDVVQEALIKVAQNLGGLVNPGAFPKWIHEILRHGCVDYLRRERRHRQGHTDFEEESASLNGGDPRSSALENRLTLEKSLESLGRDSYEVVRLRFMIGLSLKEIATVARIPVGTVKSRLHTARGQLRGLLAYNR